MKKEYYKPKKLLIGLFIFGLSLLFIGMLITINVKDGVQDSKDIMYGIGWVMSIIGMIIGEGFLLDAASHNVGDIKNGRKKK